MNENQVKCPGRTFSKSLATSLRIRYPRKASSSANGTVTTEPSKRKRIQTVASHGGKPVSRSART